MPKHFTHDMHQCFPSGAEEAFGHLRGTPARILEIGTFEGQSACWLLDNILTHPKSQYVGIEIDPERWNTTKRNLAGYDRWELILGDSTMLADTPLGSLLGHNDQPLFHGIYVDAGHLEHEAFTDALNSWALLAPGGTILFDDYTLKESSLDPSVKFGVEAGVARMRAVTGAPEGTLASNGYQYIMRKP